MHIYLKRENARRDRLAAERGLQPEDYTEEQKHAERELGDYAVSSSSSTRPDLLRPTC